MKTINISAKLFSITLLIFSMTMLSSCREDTKKEETVTKTTPAENNSEVKANTPVSGDPIAKNPAHGQAGHRCDIPVGAPLNSPPANTNSGSPVINSSSNSSSTAKLNPAHGQPGHRCDIKVGDPL